MARIAIVGENSVGYIETLLYIWNSGDCAVLIDWRIPFQTATEMMREANVHKCFMEKKLLSTVLDGLSGDIVFDSFVGGDFCAEYLSKALYNKYTSLYTYDEALVVYSSGTTGKSKGIILSHFAINTNADAIIDYMKIVKDDCIYLTKALSHASTLVGELVVALKSCMKLIVAPTVVPPRNILSNINKHRVSIICVNPLLLSLIVDEVARTACNIASLRTIYVSGSIMTDRLYERARLILKNVAVYNVYGLSEAGPRVSAQRVDCGLYNSVGRPIKNVEIAIIDEQGLRVLDGEQGVVHVSTPSRFARYITGHEKNASLYRGWLNTGDLGCLDANGELHITDRVDDIININSHKIYPAEIERQILHHTDFCDCSVVQIEYRDNVFIACLYVGRNEIEQDVRNKLTRILPAYEIPRQFVRCDRMPYKANGKIAKSEVQCIVKKALGME